MTIGSILDTFARISDAAAASGLPLEVWSHGAWYEREAVDAVLRGDYSVIRSRDGKRLYLARFWLTPPERRAGGELESGSSKLLHYIAAPDDPGHLHDHPWAFETEVLNGGYRHATQYSEYVRAPVAHPSLVNAWDSQTSRMIKGGRAHLEADDLHSIIEVEPDTWTFVRTGPRVREWGFWAPGEKWTPWKEFLAARQAQSFAGAAAQPRADHP